MSSLQYMTSHQPTVVRGTVRRSAAVSVLTHQLSGVKGCRSPVNCYVCPGTSPITSCQGSGGVVRLSVVVSALARRGLTSYQGSGGWSGTSALLRCPLTGGQLVGRRAVRRCPEVGSGKGRRLDMAEMGTLSRWIDHYRPHHLVIPMSLSPPPMSTILNFLKS
ncbi:hypothetical protein BHM03_00045825 [Ensete ventricosum]|nr:hypothetical protein BHM03_00045825 [Ensete ventricosum]